jgi:hypothetical protein
MPTLRALALALALLAACRGGGDSSKGKATRAATTEIGATDLYREYSALRGSDLLETYSGGVLVTGTISQAVELGEEGLQIWLAVDKGGVALAFTDLGTAARQKGMRPGAELHARCQIGGKPQEVLFLSGCVLR